MVLAPHPVYEKLFQILKARRGIGTGWAAVGSKTSQSSPSAARRSKPPSRAPTDPSLSSPQGASPDGPLGPISRISKVSVRVRPSNDRPSVHRCSMERPMGCRRLAPNTADPACSVPPSLPPSVAPAVDTSHCPLPLKSPRIIQWGRTDGRTEKPVSQPDVWRQRASERANPALYSLFLPFPSLPLHFPFAAAAPSLASLSQNERTNEREGERRSRGDLETTASVVVVDCTERGRESVAAWSAI